MSCQYLILSLFHSKIDSYTIGVSHNNEVKIAEKIAKISYEMVTKKKNWLPKKIITKEIEEFKGPF